jgi:hypothetical protein
MDSGHMTLSGRIKHASFTLIYYTALVLIVPAVLLFYWVKKGTLNEKNTPEFILACTNL